NPYLAWRYAYPPDGDNDTSATSWMTHALAAGVRAELDVDPAAFRGALAWVDKMTEPEFGRTGYQQRGGPTARTNEMMSRFPADKSEAMTAAGIMVRFDAGHDVKSDPAIRLSASLLEKHPPQWDAEGSVDLYYWLFGTQAMHRVGGASWESWRASLAAALLPNQDVTPGCSRGSFPPDDPWCQIGGGARAAPGA